MKKTLSIDNENFKFYHNNGSYSYGDAEYLYNIVRYFKPSKFIEIGSGNSTLMVRNAVKANQFENKNYTCNHTCIEPYEQPWLEQLDVKLIREKVEHLDYSIFKNLEKNDILFIDSSHIIRPEGDVLFEYLELLPLLKPGVIVHIHDIFTPFKMGSNTESKAEGRGVGLALCKAAIEAHGGSIKADHNKPVGGALFRFALGGVL